jgi:hypothetical protein
VFFDKKLIPYFSYFPYYNNNQKMADFSFIRDEHTRRLVSNGYDAVNQLELWSWLKTFEPNANEGFSWSNHPNINRIIQKMESLPDAPGHSGCSFALTMRHLEYIAKIREPTVPRRFAVPLPNDEDILRKTL